MVSHFPVIPSTNTPRQNNLPLSFYQPGTNLATPSSHPSDTVNFRARGAGRPEEGTRDKPWLATLRISRPPTDRATCRLCRPHWMSCARVPGGTWTSMNTSSRVWYHCPHGVPQGTTPLRSSNGADILKTPRRDTAPGEHYTGRTRLSLPSAPWGHCTCARVQTGVSKCTNFSLSKPI